MFKKLKSERFRLTILLVIGVVAFGVYVVREYTPKYLSPVASMPVEENEQKSVVTVGEKEVVVEVVDTNVSRIQGLSGRKSLAPNTGMLFVWDKEEKHTIWMKGMLFPIDIVWINSAGTVVFIERNASPDSYPAVFSTPTPSIYVLELNSGYSEALGLSVGDKVGISI